MCVCVNLSISLFKRIQSYVSFTIGVLIGNIARTLLVVLGAPTKVLKKCCTMLRLTNKLKIIILILLNAMNMFERQVFGSGQFAINALN